MVFNRDQYIYMDCKVRMSKKSLYDLMYAAIITQSGLPTSYGVGIYSLNRNQNSYNFCAIKVHIHPSQVKVFELESGLTLTKPPIININ